jgi:hypothetical protein
VDRERRALVSVAEPQDETMTTHNADDLPELAEPRRRAG